MYYQNYDDYMTNVLGYYNRNYVNMGMNDTSYQYMEQDLETMYPDAYRVVYPMVVTACDNVTMPVTEEMIDRMTDDIYDKVEADGRINIEVNVETGVKDDNNREISEETRQRRPRRRDNRFFRDLIRILLLRELLGRRGRFPFRPF